MKQPCEATLICKLKPKEIGLFRYFLEASDNLAQFTVIDKFEGIIKVFFPCESYWQVQKRLYEISHEINLFWESLHLKT